MKVLDFLNEAWLRGRFNGNADDREALNNLQNFATNPEAEVFACASGFLVLDMHFDRDVKPPVRGAFSYDKKGQLYFVGAYGIVPLTGEEHETDLMRMARAFISSKDYYLSHDGTSRFRTHYENGVFDRDEEEHKK